MSDNSIDNSQKILIMLAVLGGSIVISVVLAKILDYCHEHHIPISDDASDISEQTRSIIRARLHKTSNKEKSSLAITASHAKIIRKWSLKAKQSRQLAPMSRAKVSTMLINSEKVAWIQSPNTSLVNVSEIAKKPSEKSMNKGRPGNGKRRMVTNSSLAASENKKTITRLVARRHGTGAPPVFSISTFVVRPILTDKSRNSNKIDQPEISSKHLDYQPKLIMSTGKLNTSQQGVKTSSPKSSNVKLSVRNFRDAKKVKTLETEKNSSPKVQVNIAKRTDCSMDKAMENTSEEFPDKARLSMFREAPAAGRHSEGSQPHPAWQTINNAKCTSLISNTTIQDGLKTFPRNDPMMFPSNDHKASVSCPRPVAQSTAASKKRSSDLQVHKTFVSSWLKNSAVSPCIILNNTISATTITKLDTGPDNFINAKTDRDLEKYEKS